MKPDEKIGFERIETLVVIDEMAMYIPNVGHFEGFNETKSRKKKIKEGISRTVRVLLLALHNYDI